MENNFHEFWVNSYKKFFSPGGFLFNVGTLLTGNVAAGVIIFLTTPIITRVYAPDTFGIMTFIFSLIGVFSVTSCLRYEVAIVLPKTDTKAHNVFALCLFITAVYSVFLFILTLILRNRVANWMNVEALGSLLLFVPAAAFLSGLRISLMHWFIRLNSFRLLATSRLVESIAQSGSKILAGLLFGSFAVWLIAGNVAGILIATIMLAIIFKKKHLNDFKKNVCKEKLANVAREFKKFPQYNSLSSIIGSSSARLPGLLFVYYFPLEILGFYALAIGMLKKPAEYLSAAVERVFLQKAAEMQSEGRSHRDLIISGTLGLALASIIPFGGIIIGGPWIFSIVFGKEWVTAGYYAQLLAPWLFLVTINPFATQIILVKQKLSFLLKFDIVLFVFRALAIVGPSSIASEPWIVIALLSAVGTIANLILIVYAFILTKDLDTQECAEAIL